MSPSLFFLHLQPPPPVPGESPLLVFVGLGPFGVGRSNQRASVCGFIYFRGEKRGVVQLVPGECWGSYCIFFFKTTLAFQNGKEGPKALEKRLPGTSPKVRRLEKNRENREWAFAPLQNKAAAAGRPPTHRICSSESLNSASLVGSKQKTPMTSGKCAQRGSVWFMKTRGGSRGTGLGSDWGWGGPQARSPRSSAACQEP